jgi:hypothetical protein
VWTIASGAAGPDEPPVRVSIERREGTGATVCLQAGPEVRGRKRALVTHGGGSAVLDVSRESPGPHCAELAHPAGTVTVDLQYRRLWVIPSHLARHSYPADEARGRRFTFLWVRD